MTTTYSNLLSGKYIEATQTTQYTSSGVKTRIDKCTIANISSNNVQLSVNIVNNGSSAADSNLVIPDRTIQPKETYLCPELIGVILESGDFISAISSAASALTINISGRTI